MTNYEAIIEKVLDTDFDKVFEGGIEAVRTITKECFSECADCVMTYEGSDDYYDASYGNWLPGDAPEFEVYGYESYIKAIVDELSFAIARFYGIEQTKELELAVEQNLSDLTDGEVLDTDDFEEEAIENYDNY